MTFVAAPSLFQILPPVIIELIVDYVIADSKPNDISQKSIGLAITQTCMPWRSVFIRRVGRTLRLNFYPANSAITFLHCHDVINPLDYPITQFVKTIIVDIAIHNVVADGSALAMLESSLPKNAIFPLVRTIIVDLNAIVSSGGGSPIPNDDSNCFHYLFQHIRKITPNVQMADISWDRWTDDGYIFAPKYDIDDAISKFLRGIKGIKFVGNSERNSPVKLNPRDISELVHIDMVLGVRQMSTLRIISKSASSLRSIKLKGLKKVSIKYLVVNSASKTVVYPHLESLIITNGYEKFDERDSTILSQSIHFPALKKLDIMPLGPFLSNLITNCQSSTLETLNMLFFQFNHIDYSTYKPFKSADFTNLKSLNIRYYPKKGGRYYQPSAVTDIFAQHLIAPILNSTSVLRSVSINRMVYYDFLFHDISTRQWIRKLEKLDIPFVQFSLPDISLLLQNASGLTTLVCSAKKNISNNKSDSDSTLLDHIEPQSFPISSSLFSLKLWRSGAVTLEQLTFYFLLFIIGCPNLNIVLTAFSTDEIKGFAQNLVNTKPFTDYAELYEKLNVLLRYTQ